MPPVTATVDACEESYWQVGARHLVADLLLLVGDLQAGHLLHEAQALCAEVADEHHRALVQAKLAWMELLRREPTAALVLLPAPIAHEVNNPIAVIQGNMDLLRKLLGPEGSLRIAAELKLVDEQIESMRQIVTKTLQFARPR